MAHPYWPLFDLVVRTPRLELRFPTDETCVELASIASPEMFPDGEIHFVSDWLSDPSPVRERKSMQWWWRQRANFSPEAWQLEMAVIVDGHPVGVQELNAEKFVVQRSVHTGSWLAASHQGHGLGTEMRAAILHLAFAGLGAHEALSGAFLDNVRSIRVSRRLGYEDNGQQMGLRAGSTQAVHQNFRMTRERFDQRRRPDITIENLEPCLELFGLGPDLEPLVTSAAGGPADASP
jgi:RimJ/RimL family protein N-acetyltransferase